MAARVCNKWTPARKADFLAVLAATANVSAAARAAGGSRRGVYDARAADPDFAAAWEDALAEATDALEAEARRRAVEGVAAPLVSGGKLVRGDDGAPLTVRRFSDGLMTLLLKAHRPEKFRERTDIELSGKGGAPLTVKIVRFGEEGEGG